VLALINLDQERNPPSLHDLRNYERVGRVVIRPDHSQKLGLSGNSWFFTGSQLEDLTCPKNENVA